MPDLLGAQPAPFSRSFPLPLTVLVLPQSVTELGLAVVLHTVRVTLAVVLLHWTPGVRLTAGSEILAVPGQDNSDVAVWEARPRQTSWLESGGLLQLDQDHILSSSLTVTFPVSVVVGVKWSDKVWSVKLL